MIHKPSHTSSAENYDPALAQLHLLKRDPAAIATFVALVVATVSGAVHEVQKGQRLHPPVTSTSEGENDGVLRPNLLPPEEEAYPPVLFASETEDEVLRPALLPEEPEMTEDGISQY